MYVSRYLGKKDACSIYSHDIDVVSGQCMPFDTSRHRHHCNIVCVQVFKLAVLANFVILVRVSQIAPCCLLTLVTLSLIANIGFLYYFKKQVT